MYQLNSMKYKECFEGHWSHLLFWRDSSLLCIILIDLRGPSCCLYCKGLFTLGGIHSNKDNLVIVAAAIVIIYYYSCCCPYCWILFSFIHHPRQISNLAICMILSLSSSTELQKCVSAFTIYSFFFTK